MQAPIGPATTPELVASVSAVGALGTVAASWTESSKLRDQIRAIRSATSNPFCVNLVLAFDQRERLELVLAERVPVVSFSWGTDPELIGRARAAGAFVLVQASDVGRGEGCCCRRRERRDRPGSGGGRPRAGNDASLDVGPGDHRRSAIASRRRRRNRRLGRRRTRVDCRCPSSGVRHGLPGGRRGGRPQPLSRSSDCCRRRRHGTHGPLRHRLAERTTSRDSEPDRDRLGVCRSAAYRAQARRR